MIRLQKQEKSMATNEPEVVKALKETLKKAQTALYKQREIIVDLTRAPYHHGTVTGFRDGVQILNTEADADQIFREGRKVYFHENKSDRGTIARHLKSERKVKINWASGQTDVVNESDLTCPETHKPLVDEAVKPAKTVILFLSNGEMIESEMPTTIELKVGDMVRVNRGGAIIGKVDNPVASTNPAQVVQTLDDGRIEVSLNGVNLVVDPGNVKGIENEDRVLLDMADRVVMDNLGKNGSEFTVNFSTGVSWDDIGGMTDAKQLLREAVEFPHIHSDLFKTYAKKPAHGVLLYGPPGCGKTMLGKAAATAIQNIYKGKPSPYAFMLVKGPEILDKYVGNSELKIRNLFARARKHHQQFGYPSVILIDEADAVLRKRDSGISSDVLATIVPMFLNEMDGLDQSGAMVLLSTNRADELDSAVVREGRVDMKIKVPRPTMPDAQHIFTLHLSKTPLREGTTAQMAKRAAEELFSDKYALFDISLRNRQALRMFLRDGCSGAMIASIVNASTDRAIRDDIAAKRKKDFGLTELQICGAIKDLHRQYIDLDNRELVSEILLAHNASPRDVVTLSRAKEAEAAA